MEGFFGWLGNALGSAIKLIVDALRTVFGGIGDAIDAFFRGLANALGMSPSIFNYLWLIGGLILLVVAVKAFAKRAVLAGIIWLVLGLLVLGGLIS